MSSLEYGPCRGNRMPRLPSLPRLPFVRDPLRRVRIPDDLDQIISVGEEEPARAGGMDERSVERIWEAALDLYRSGVHPALQI